MTKGFTDTYRYLHGELPEYIPGGRSGPGQVKLTILAGESIIGW